MSTYFDLSLVISSNEMYKCIENAVKYCTIGRRTVFVTLRVAFMRLYVDFIGLFDLRHLSALHEF